MFSKPVASILAIVVASLATSVAYAAPKHHAKHKARDSHSAVIEAASASFVTEVPEKKRTAQSTKHARGRHVIADPAVSIESDAKSDDKVEKVEKIEKTETIETIHEKVAKPKLPHAGHHALHAQSKPKGKTAPALAHGQHVKPSARAESTRGPSKASTPKAEPVKPRQQQHVVACDKQKAPVQILANADSDTFPLANCDGRAAMYAAERLSVLARPGGAPKPTQTIGAMTKIRGPILAPNVRRVSYGLVERLQKIVDHFAHPGQTTHITLVSGYRPSSAGSFHASARALDFRIDGVTNEALVAFCKTLDDTGCGFYPNSVFIHLDVRDAGTGHVAWIDASGPGQTARYVDQWPPPDRLKHKKARVDGDTIAHLDNGLPPLPSDDHPQMPPHAEPDIDSEGPAISLPETPETMLQ